VPLTSALRKLLLSTHVVASVGWIGALAVFLAHAVTSVASADVQLVRSACVAMAVSAWLVILPFSIVSLTTGIMQALTTAWGLIRHYWVLFKLLLTVVATAVLLLKLAPIQSLADAAQQLAVLDPGTREVRVSLLLHAIGGLVFLLIATVLAIYKPAGVIRFGKLARPDMEVPVGTGTAAVPAWVKWSAVVTLLIVLVVLSMALFGLHHPGSHIHG
jgi:hypothetical protein